MKNVFMIVSIIHITKLIRPLWNNADLINYRLIESTLLLNNVYIKILPLDEDLWDICNFMGYVVIEIAINAT